MPEEFMSFAGNIMKNGCPKCEKLDNALCPVCLIGMLEYEAETALRNLVEGYRKLLNLESEGNNEFPSS